MITRLRCNIVVPEIDSTKAGRSNVGVRLSQYEEEGYLILPEVLRPDQVRLPRRRSNACTRWQPPIRRRGVSVRAVHGPNRSDRPRHTALYAYFPPNVRYVPSDRQPRERQYRVVAGLEGRSSFTLRAG